MRTSICVLIFALALASCESKRSSEQQPPAKEKAVQKPTAPLADLTTASTLAAVRAAFNAHKGEARFLTLLSPT